jgi:tRNA threonylcarbamoyladenosine biosynthesis protein TsaE
MHESHITLTLPDEAATLRLGAVLAATLKPGIVVWLEGDLGTGKTTLVRGLMREAGEAGPVKSPTYTLVEVHLISGLYFYHFDFYRFNQAEEYLDAGLDEYFSGNGICLAEWPDKARPYLADADLRIRLHVANVGRRVELESFSERGAACLVAVTSSNTLPPA